MYTYTHCKARNVHTTKCNGSIWFLGFTCCYCRCRWFFTLFSLSLCMHFDSLLLLLLLFLPFVRFYDSVSLVRQWREIKRIKNYPKAIVVSHNNRISQQHHCHHNHFIIHYHHRTSTQKFCFVWCLIEHEHVQCKRKRALFRRRQTLKIPRQKMRNTQQQTHTSIICVVARKKITTTTIMTKTKSPSTYAESKVN